MRKLPKTLGLGVDAPETVALMRLIETQSKTTIGRWCVDYCVKNVLPIWERRRPDDERARTILTLASEFLDGKVKLTEVKQFKRDCGAVAHEFDKDPVLLAAARSIFDTAIQSIHSPTGSLGFLWYATAAIAYDRVGLDESEAVYNALASEICADYTAALRAVAVENEPNPAKVKWEC
jgi:hypothetical protein